MRKLSYLFGVMVGLTGCIAHEKNIEKLRFEADTEIVEIYRSRMNRVYGQVDLAYSHGIIPDWARDGYYGDLNKLYKGGLDETDMVELNRINKRFIEEVSIFRELNSIGDDNEFKEPTPDNQTLLDI